jgi:hypothetical protein
VFRLGLCRVSTATKMRIKEWLDMQRILKPSTRATSEVAPLVYSFYD